MSPATRRALATLLAAGLAAAGRAGAQGAQGAQGAPGEEPPEPPATLPDGTRRVAGTVVRVADTASVPVPGAWVVLHRVGSDAAGPVDSARTDARGGYAFRYRPSGSADALYFVSTTHAGIAYFTRPLREASVAGDAAEITVFDTTSAPVPIQVRGRHTIVSAPDSAGGRMVLEVFELSNDTSVTVVAPAASGRGVWSVALPAGAGGVEVRPGDLPADAVATAGGRVTVFAPFAPGLKQLAFSYRVPEDRFPLALAIERPTSVLEVLVEDPAGTATGGRLVAVTPVTLEGRSFRRFLAQDVPGGARIEIGVGAASGGGRWVLPAVLATVGALMLGALAVAMRRRRGAPPAAPAPSMAPVPAAAPVAPAAESASARLAREIAALDDAHERAAEEARARGDAAPPDGEAYARRRAELKRRLAEALAREAAPR